MTAKEIFYGRAYRIQSLKFGTYLELSEVNESGQLLLSAVKPGDTRQHVRLTCAARVLNLLTSNSSGNLSRARVSTRAKSSAGVQRRLVMASVCIYALGLTRRMSRTGMYILFMLRANIEKPRRGSSSFRGTVPSLGQLDFLPDPMNIDADVVFSRMMQFSPGIIGIWWLRMLRR